MEFESISTGHLPKYDNLVYHRLWPTWAEVGRLYREGVLLELLADNVLLGADAALMFQYFPLHFSCASSAQILWCYFERPSWGGFFSISASRIHTSIQIYGEVGSNTELLNAKFVAFILYCLLVGYWNLSTVQYYAMAERFQKDPSWYRRPDQDPRCNGGNEVGGWPYPGQRWCRWWADLPDPSCGCDLYPLKCSAAMSGPVRPQVQLSFAVEHTFSWVPFLTTDSSLIQTGLKERSWSSLVRLLPFSTWKYHVTCRPYEQSLNRRC